MLTTPVLAVSNYGEKCRSGLESEIDNASRELYEEMTRPFGPRDFDAHDHLAIAISEHGEACRKETPKG